jgi:hypothetical protein
VIARIDWVGENGYPYSASLGDDGLWTCTEKILTDMINIRFSPGRQGSFRPNFVAAKACADYFGGQLHYFEIPPPPDDSDAVE